MIEIKRFKPVHNSCLTDYAIFKLSTEEAKLVGGKRFHVNHTLRLDYVNKDIETFLEQALTQSEYTYGIGFCDTEREAELYYMCCVLENQVKRQRDTINELIAGVRAPDVSVFESHFMQPYAVDE